MSGEICWNWAQIFIVLMAKLAPVGVEINPDDVVALPMDKVLSVHRDAEAVTLSWVGIADAHAMTNPIIEVPGAEKPSVSQLQGRYMKLACILAHKLAPNGIRLTQADADLIPEGQFVFEDGIEYKWLPVAQGLALRRRERDNEGRERIVTKGGFNS